MHILPAVVDNRRNHAGLEDVGAEDVQQAPAAGEAPSQRGIQIPGSGQVVVALDALGADHAVYQQLQVVLLGKGKCIVHYHHTEKDVPVKGDVIEIVVLLPLPSADEPGLRVPPIAHSKRNRHVHAALLHKILVQRAVSLHQPVRILIQQLDDMPGGWKPGQVQRRIHGPVDERGKRRSLSFIFADALDYYIDNKYPEAREGVRIVKKQEE